MFNVTSSTLKSLMYEASTQSLLVEFHNGNKQYRYEPVPRDVYTILVAFDELNKLSNTQSINELADFIDPLVQEYLPSSDLDECVEEDCRVSIGKVFHRLIKKNVPGKYNCTSKVLPWKEMVSP